MKTDEVTRTERQLDSVRDEIERIERDGQEAEFESNGARRRMRRTELATLYARERELISRMLRLTGRGVSFVTPSDYP